MSFQIEVKNTFIHVSANREEYDFPIRMRDDSEVVYKSYKNIKVDGILKPSSFYTKKSHRKRVDQEITFLKETLESISHHIKYNNLDASNTSIANEMIYHTIVKHEKKIIKLFEHMGFHRDRRRRITANILVQTIERVGDISQYWLEYVKKKSRWYKNA